MLLISLLHDFFLLIHMGLNTLCTIVMRMMTTIMMMIVNTIIPTTTITTTSGVLESGAQHDDVYSISNREKKICIKF